jgi:hypothetical protein
MTIKSKLIANVVVIAVIIIASSMASYFSLRFVQEKLSYLTKKSTPFQIRTIELQRELQGYLTTLVKVNAARSLAEYRSIRGEAEASHEMVENTRRSLQKFTNGVFVNADVLDNIMRELFTAVEERIISSEAAISANTKALQNMNESSARLNELDSSIRKLQVSYSKAFAAALADTGTYSEKLRSIEELRNHVRELQLITVNVQNTQNAAVVLIANGKLKAVGRRIAANDSYKSNQAIAAITAGFIDKLAEYISLQSAALTQKDENSKNRAAAAGKDISYKLNDLFQTLDQDTMLARDELALAAKNQGRIFNQSNHANGILVASSELLALGLKVTGETNRLFTLESVEELDKLDAVIRDLFAQIQSRLQAVEASLAKLDAEQELKDLRAAAVSLAVIRSALYSADGIIATLKMKLNAITRANQASDKLHEIVIQQSVQGKENVASAQGEQEKSISAVNRMVRQSLSSVVGIGAVAIFIGMFFGFWIYRSVLPPLHVVLDAVRRQQEQGREKANLAEAVAGGDLNQEVVVSKALTIDPTQMNNDEMGMLLSAVVGMSEAQVTLDKAFAGMTASLRSNRDDDARRDRLKNGLYELNKILRGEHKNEDLAEYALAFIAAFLDAGVGVIYQYNEKEEKLKTLATYAISRSNRLNEDIRPSEGLVGQVALERKMINLNTVPPDYLPIGSALGGADPLNIVIMPIMHNDTLVGVLELGSFRPFNDDNFDFLNQSLEGIAIAIKVNRSRQLVDDLLEQTQQQAEELRVRQEETLQANEELSERAGTRTELRPETAKTA